MIEQGERADAPAPHSPARAAEQAGAARWGATGGGSRFGGSLPPRHRAGWSSALGRDRWAITIGGLAAPSAGSHSLSACSSLCGGNLPTRCIAQDPIMAFGQHRFAFAGKDAHVVVTRTRSMQRARFGTLTVHKSDRAQLPSSRCVLRHRAARPRLRGRFVARRTLRHAPTASASLVMAAALGSCAPDAPLCCEVVNTVCLLSI